MSNTDPTKNQGRTQVPENGKQFMSLIRHPPCFWYSQDVFYITILKDPRPFVNGDHDMWGSSDGDSLLYHCTGFIAFQPSPLSEDRLEKWKTSLETPDINQFKFNSLLKKSAIRHKYLPRKEFSDGQMYFNRGKRKMLSLFIAIIFLVMIGKYKDLRVWVYGEVTNDL